VFATIEPPSGLSALLGAAVPVDVSWNFEPVVLLAIVGYGVAYTLRWRRSREQGGPRAAGLGRLALWWGGIVALAVALVSPLDRLSEQFATAHMLQHLLLADVVPILFTLALTKWILRPVTRHVHRIERAAGPFGHPVFGVVAYVGAMWLWHVPALYLGPILYMASTKILVGFLGVLLTFAPELLYDFYDTAGTRWGLSPHDDQQVAGLVMALEQSLVMGVALAYLFVRMLAESDAADERAERYA
jgi:cytochrome c oxidase assembly factor CtaG